MDDGCGGAPAGSVGRDLVGAVAAGQVLVDHAASLKKEPPIRLGTPDPYIPAQR